MSDPSDPIHSFLEAVGLTVDESRKLGDLLKTHVGRFSPSEKDAARLRDLLENPGREEEGTVLGRYLDLGVLGMGDMAEVRRVSDVVLKRTLAMRIIHAKKLDDPEAVRWFIEEARVGAQLQHPGIVPIYEIGQLPDGRHYYTMNEVQGTEFTLSIAAIHRASPEELGEHSPTDTRLLHLVQILHRVCVTVAYAHARGVFHGDLTPGNIRVGEFGEVLVVNWGSVAGTSRGPSSDPGTTDGGHTGIGKDILGLGAILHQVLHGFPPPENPATTGPARAQGGSPALPPRLASICNQALSQEPGRRQAQARDLAHQLQTWLEGAAAGDHPAARTPEPSSTADEEDTPRERELAIPRADEQVEKGTLAGEQPQDEEARTEPTTPLDGTESEDSKLALIEANRFFELGTLEREQANFDEARQCQKTALELYRRHGNRSGEGAALAALSHIAMEQGRPPQAIEGYRRALTIHRELGDRRSEAGVLGSLSGALLAHGNLDDALAIAQEALALHRQMGDKREEGRVLSNLAGACQARGQTDQAIEYLRLALQIHREIGDKRQQGIALGHLGTSYQARGELHKAVSHYHLARRIHRDVGDECNEGVVLGNLGDALFLLERWEEAEKTLSRAIQLCDADLPPAAGAFRGSLALLLAGDGQLKKANRLIKKAEAQVEGHPMEYGKFLCKKGRVQLLGGKKVAASASLDRARDLEHQLKTSEHSELGQAIAELVILLQEVGHGGKEPASAGDSEEAQGAAHGIVHGDAQLELGHIERTEGNFKEAARCFRKALTAYQALGHAHGEARALSGLGGVFRVQGQIQEAAEHFQAALAHCLTSGDRRMEGACLSNLGLIHADAGQLDKAIEAYELALEVHASTGDKRNRGVVLGNLGNVYTNRGLHEQALQSFQEALQIHRETGDRRNTAFTHGYLGVHHGTQDRFEEALKEFEEATAIFRELGDKTQAGVNLGNQGEALQQLHRGEEALAVLEEAIRLCDEVQHYPAAGSFRGALGLLLATRGQMDEAHDLFRIGESQVKNMAPVLGKLLCQKGTAHLLDQRPGDARDALAQAQCIAEEMEVNEHSELARVISGLEGLLLDVADPTQEPSSVPTATRPGHLASLEGARLLEIGHIEREEGNSEQARANYQQALDHFREQGDREGEAEAHNGLGNAYLKLGDPDKAMEHLLLSLAYHREMGSQRFEGVILSNLGNIFRSQGRFPEAFEHYRGALVIHEATGDTLNHAIAQGNLGLVSAVQGQQEEAIAHYQRSLALHRKVGSHGAGVILSNLGNAFHVQGRHEEALAHHQEALDIHRSTGSKRSEGIALGNLGRALLRLQRHEEARKALEEAIVICDESAPEAGGAFRSVLALLDASEGQFGNVEELLAHGEPLLEDTPFDHGKFLCNKGRVQLLQDQKRAAEQSLAQAQGIAEELEVTEHSELAQAIAEFKGLLAEA